MKSLSTMKKTLLSLGLLSMIMLGSLSGIAQEKIGYTNVELVLLYMPETKAMDQQIQSFQTLLSEQLKVKDDYAVSKLNEYQEKASKNLLSETDRIAAEQELANLDTEIKTFAQESEYKIEAKRQELLTPILQKLEQAINDVAEENGYTFILNSTINGMSNVLYGPEKQDVTEAIMDKLGIKLPAAE